jgi:hypothetical protein
MSNFKVTVNKRRLMKELILSGKPSMTQQVTEAYRPIVERAQKQLIKEFEKHPVTKELDAGKTASNTSGLLGGYGNLFSFLGFSVGSYPTQTVREILDKKIDVTAVRRGDQGKFIIYLDIPSKEEILAATANLKWLTGRSWVDGIEHGISGFGRYLYNEDGFGPRSQSTTGIQYKGGKAYSGRFQNTKYISAMLDNFRKRLL